MDSTEIKFNLSRKWEAFLDISNACKEEKLTALEEFLLYFMSVYKTIDLDLQIYMRSLNGISSVLTRHFLCDVHEICSKSKNKDEEKLINYLLSGRGASILCALEVTGVQELTCNWELANLLLTITSAFQSYTSNETTRSLFAVGLKDTLKVDDVVELIPAMLWNCVTSCERTGHRFGGEILSGDVDRKTSNDFRSGAANAEEIPSDFNEASNATRNSFASPAAVKRNNPLDARHVSDCVFSLLEQLCQNDARDMPVPTVSSMVLHVVLDLLRTGNEDVVVDDKAVLVHSVYMTQKMVALVVRTSISLLGKLTDSKALPKSCPFSVVLQIVKKRLQFLEEQDTAQVSADRDTMDIVRQEVLLCTLGCLKVLHAGSVVKLGRATYGDVLKLFHSFLKSEGCELLCRCLARLDGSLAPACQSAVHHVIGTLGEIGFSVRRARAMAYHWELGARHCCRTAKPLPPAHHHALGGVHLGPFRNYAPSQCPIAAVANALLSRLTSSGDEAVMRATAAALCKCGVCCCLDLKDVFRSVVSGLHRSNAPQIQELLLHVLENALLAFSGCTVMFDCAVATCTQCEARLSHNRTVLEAAVKSACSQKAQGADFENCFWSVLDLYLHLLNRADGPLLKMLERHLFAVLNAGDQNLRLEMYLRVFLPLLSDLCNQFRRRSDFNEELALFGLNAVVSLLRLPDAYRLLHVGASIDDVLELICSAPLRHAVLRLLQAVMLEETKAGRPATGVDGAVSSGSGESEAGPSSGSRQDKESVLKLYHDTLLRHTNWFVESIRKGSCSSSSPPGPNESKNGDGDLVSHGETTRECLSCLTDLWKTVCHMMDRSSVYRDVLWEAPVKSVVCNAIEGLLGRDDPDGVDQELARMELDLLGMLLHVVTVCEVGTNAVQCNTEMSNLLTILRDRLTADLSVRNSTYVRHLFEALLNASLETNATPLSTVLLLRKQRSFASQFDCSDCRSVDEDSPPWSRSSSPDRGYDGDAEDDDAAHKKSAPEPAVKMYRTENAGDRRLTVICPTVLSLLLDLAAAYERLAFATSDLGCGTAVEEATATLTWLGRALVEICQADGGDALNRCKVVDVILDGFRHVLGTCSPSCSDLQDIVLALFVSCAQRGIRACQLQSYLKFFSNPQIPVGKFLEALRSLVATMRRRPLHCIQFLNGDAAVASGDVATLPSNESSLSSLYRSSDTVFSQRGSKNAGRVDSALVLAKQSLTHTTLQHRSHCLGSCWAKTSIAGCFPLPPDPMPFWDGGLGVSCWISVGDPSYPDASQPPFGSSEHHLLSCGMDSLVVEVWWNQDTRRLVLKLATSSTDAHNVLDEKILMTPVDLHVWQHLSVSWMALKKNRKFVLQVFVHVNVDGSSAVEAVSLECQWSDWHPGAQHWFLMLGHCEGGPFSSVSWSLGNLKVFRGAFLSPELPDLLAALGPDCAQIEMVTDDWNDSITDDPQLESALQDLRAKLLVSYLPHDAGNFTWHPSGTWSRSVSRPATTTSSPPVLKFGDFCSMETSRVEAAVMRLGGAPVLVSLFALIVDLHDDEDVQADCLAILVSCNSKSVRFRSAFSRISGWDLVMKVLSTSKCIIGCRMLSVLLDACTSEPILLHDLLDGHWKLNKLTAATVTDARLLSLLLKNWKVFRSGRNSIFFWLLKVFEIAIHEHHPKRPFNLEAFHREKVADHLITICKEQVLEEEHEAFSPRICHSVVGILRSLTGKEPDGGRVKQLMDFLIAVHPPSQTYVCHARSSFYFLPAGNLSNAFNRPGRSGALRKTASLPTGQMSYFTNLSKESEAADQQPLSGDGSSDSDAGVGKYGERSAVNVADDGGEELLGVAGTSCSEGFLTAASSTLSLETCTTTTDVSNASAESISPESSRPGLDDSLETVVSAEAISPEDGSGKAPPESSEETFSLESGNYNGSGAAQDGEVDEIYRGKPNDGSAFDEVKSASGVSSLSGSADLGIVLQGVLEIIGSAFKVSSASYVSQLLEVIDPNVLVVLALHPYDGVRTEVMKVFKLYLENADEEHSTNLVKRNVLNLFANQLYQYDVSPVLIETCIGILFRKDFSFKAWEEEMTVFESSSWNLAAIPVILSVLPRTHHTEILCHNYLAFLLKMCRQFPIFYREFVNGGLIQSLCLTISATMNSPSRSQDIDYKVKDVLVLKDISALLANVIVYFIQLSGSPNGHIVFDLLNLVSYYEQLESEKYGFGSDCVKGFRDCQCTAMFYAFRKIQTHFDWNDEQFVKLLNAEDATHPVGIAASEKRASDSELKERFKDLLQKAVDFLLFADVVTDELFISNYEIAFSRFLFQLVLEGSMAILTKRQSVLTLKWHSLVYATHDALRVQLGRLLVFLISPTQSLGQRLFIVELLISKHRHKDLVQYVLKSNIQLDQKFFIFLDLLLRDNYENIANVEMIKCLALQNSLRNSTGHLDVISSSLSKEAWIEESIKSKHLWRGMHTLLVHKILQKLEMQIKLLGKSAMDVTCAVVDRQNEQRQLILAHVKFQFSERLRTNQYWQMIVRQLTHERAIWHSPESYPQSWQLDPTEGPLRVRKRFERCQLTIKQRFLLPEYRNKLQAATHPKRFAYLFKEDANSSNLAIIKDHLHNAEKIRCTYSCVIVTPSTEAKGELLLGNHCLYYIGEESSSLKMELNEDASNPIDVVSHTWYFNDIKEIMKRRFQLQDNALELFLVYGQTFLIAFASLQERNALYDQLMASNLMNLLIESGNLAAQTQMWRDRMITNFEYLTQLNKIAGRSFNDLMQYPVFPFILADYRSPVLNLANPKSFRNLPKPMAVQDENREQHYINQYSFLQKEQAEPGFEDYLMPALGPYHYGSHYSNSGIILHFLVRLPPFTSMFLSYQDNNFDIPDRTFHSLQTSWRLSSADSTTDVKELIPEFFFLPEMLKNSEGFDFGIRQSGEPVHDVILPDWCRNDPRLFILIHRQALESPYVTERLHNWIDLVFGFKQTGHSAVDAINVFHPATYYGFDVDQIKDPLRQNAMRTMIKTFGQTPCQLFRHAHPMISLSLNRQQQQTRSCKVMKEVQDLSWGRYVGSPEESDPTVIWRKRHSCSIGSFVPMVTNEVFGLTKKTALLVQYCKDKGASMINTTYVTSAALIFYGNPDGVIRLQLKRGRPSQAFIANDIVDPVTCCSTAPDCMLLFLGKSSGNIVVYEVEFEPSKFVIQPNVRFRENLTVLYGHNSSISSIHMCKSFSVAVSASADSTCIIWDLNRLSYVRSISDHNNEVHLVRVSDTSGDIVSISNQELGKGSCLMLHTINAELVKSISTTETIHSVCFSNATEGISVNVVCAGLSDGSIWMWSTWDLMPVRKIHFPKFNSPVVCLAYSLDCQHMYAANIDGVVIILQSPSKNSTSATPKFRTLI